jgi:[acyl-carrier-protein] S-malonyltransferase
VALWETLRKKRAVKPIMAAGHSVGEYAALVAAGGLDFETALDVIRVRAKGMDEAQPQGLCGMAALIGPGREDALKIVELHRGEDTLEAANFNAPDQTVISGHMAAIDRVLDAVSGERRTRAVKLTVSSAFHTSLMAPAKVALSERLADVVFGKMNFPVLSNVTGLPYPDSEDAKQLLVEQVISPVLWIDCVKALRGAGDAVPLEVGPGKVLSGLLRRIERGAKAVNISDLDSILSLEEAS